MDANDLNKGEVEQIIKEYLSDNPEVIVEALSNYQRVSQEKRVSQAKDYIVANRDVIENDPKTPIIGNPDGDIVVVEFFDYLCGYCKKAFPNIVKLVEEDKNVKVVLKELPILGEASVLSSKAALAVFLAAPEKYFAFHQALIEGRTSSKEAILKIASDLAIDTKVIEDGFTSKEVEALIAQNRQLASNLGIQGTPAFVIGGEFVPGYVDYDALKAIVSSVRQKEAAASPEAEPSEANIVPEMN
jgi:protein-disulfide isomerase